MELSIQILNSPAVKGTFCFCVSVAEPRRCFLGVCAPTQQPTAGDGVIKKLSAMQLNILAHQAVEVFNPLWSRGLNGKESKPDSTTHQNQELEIRNS